MYYLPVCIEGEHPPTLYLSEDKSLLTQIQNVLVEKSVKIDREGRAPGRHDRCSVGFIVEYTPIWSKEHQRVSLDEHPELIEGVLALEP